MTKTTYKELYNNTLNREQIIKDLGYNLIVIWEEKYKNSLDKDKNYEKF